MKQWWSTNELIEARLPGLASAAAISRCATEMNWAAAPDRYRRRAGRGGAREIHLSLLPQLAQDALAARAAMDRINSAPLNETSEQISYKQDAANTSVERRDLDARLAILSAIQSYQNDRACSFSKALRVVSDQYNAGEIKIANWVKDTIPSFKKSAAYNWRAAMENGDFSSLASTKKLSRAQTGVLEAAHSGAVKQFILGLIAKQPHLSCKPIRAAVIAKFGESFELVASSGEVKTVACPPLRTFQHHIKAWKQEHANELLRLTNPDKYKGSVRMVAAGGASANIHRLNQLWEIDASPADVMTTEGRWHIYACVDVFSRRALVLVTQTPRADAVGVLIRDAIAKWGVPEAVKTDNGSDFVAKQTERLFAALGVEVLTCDAYSPEQKPHVERFIGTWQRGFAELLPGYVGHSVADRTVIESRKRFSDRLGTSDAEIFAVDLSPQELQEASNQWVETVYEHNRHGALGCTPFTKAQQYTGSIKTVDETALNVLLAPIASGNGIRTVTKSGIRCNNEHYLIGNVMVGERVFCRQDPRDLGKLFVFSDDGEQFLGHAFAPVLAGLDPVKTIAHVRKMQKALEEEQITSMRRQMRKIGPRDVLNAVLEQGQSNVTAFPKPSETHSTPMLSAAGEVTKLTQPELPDGLDDVMAQIKAELDSETTQPAQPPKTPSQAQTKPSTATNTRPIKAESQFDRYRRALALEKRISAGDPLSEADARWLAGYREGAEYKSMKIMADEFGESFLEG
ncbi:DDE-type integrase/transposase/recombinase [Polycladidibacter hongkongensis]|uniref:DDE-type integrase/transposase/recombinase n=1 Tax=Polycladidibacter hongkongensis TaxID=1647556 RepID=UPI000834C26E|nr:DDE-type integrase/transposase/recombinase [Pseudovibrio hongkongensis]